MQQLIRNKTFETNSSSTHTLAVYKSNEDVSEIGLEEHIPILTEFYGHTTEPEKILSYLYTIALISHDWKLIDKIKYEFPSCIFQRPQWNLPYKSKTGFCDDREVISFCELVSSDMPCYFSDEDRTTIWVHLKEFVFSGELYVAQDGDYIIDCVVPSHNLDAHNSDELNNWIDNNIDIIISN